MMSINHNIYTLYCNYIIRCEPPPFGGVDRMHHFMSGLYSFLYNLEMKYNSLFINSYSVLGDIPSIMPPIYCMRWWKIHPLCLYIYIYTFADDCLTAAGFPKGKEDYSLFFFTFVSCHEASGDIINRRSACLIQWHENNTPELLYHKICSFYSINPSRWALSLEANHKMTVLPACICEANSTWC